MSSERINHKVLVPFDYNNKIIEKSGDARIYREAVLLTPGTWTDATSRTPITYSDNQLKLSATKWESNFLNIDHSPFTLDRIGYVKNPYYKKGKVLSDLHIYPITQNSRDVISLIDAGFVNSLSVELSSVDKWDFDTNERLAQNIIFHGCAVVLLPACNDTKIK